MAAGGAPGRQLRRGPAPIASFDHDGSDEVRPSSPETKQTFRLPEIREDPVSGSSLAPPEPRARSHSTPTVSNAGAPGGTLGAPAAPRIDISRASSSSHHDSRDSSPELALFAGGEDSRNHLELGFREEGALELRSSTEELAFLEGVASEARGGPGPARRPSRKDSQCSEAALLAVSGRTSRVSSVGSQCSALSAVSRTSRVSRLSVVSGASRSPSPHKMLLETSFCGPKPIETDPEICAAAVEERLLEIAKLGASSPMRSSPAPLDARDRREVRTEATVERASRPPPPSPVPAALPAVQTPVVITDVPPDPMTVVPTRAAIPDDEKLQKESQNRARAQERRARPRVRREPSEPEVYKSGNLTKDIIRIKLKPDDEYEEEEVQSSSLSTEAVVSEEVASKPASLELAGHVERAVRPTDLAGRPEAAPPSPARAPRDSRTPSPAGGPVSRKSSFCSLFKSRETIASPDSPSDVLRRKRSLTEGRSRSKSRDRSATPSSVGKIRGSVLSLFKTPRKSCASPSPGSREGSPVIQTQRALSSASHSTIGTRRGGKLKYYEDTRDGIIHIPLRTPPEERSSSEGARADRADELITRPLSAPHGPPPAQREGSTTPVLKPVHRTVLPDGSIIIPLRSPTEKTSEDRPLSSPVRMTPTSTDDTSAEVEPDCRSLSARSTDDARPAECAPSIEPVEVGPAIDDSRRRKKERIMFSTHVGSRDQVFCTQFSITKTPSVTSEISGSFPSFVDHDEARGSTTSQLPSTEGPALGPSRAELPPAESPQEGARDSSESEASSECAAPASGNEVERRGLVVQESFEEELPFVPTTLPQERSLALPMVPVRDRAAPSLRAVQRPRAAQPAPPRATPLPRQGPTAAPAPPARLHIRLPRRPRTSSVAAPPPPPCADRARTRSTGDETRPKTEWIDFEEVPERRKQAKRIQTLPAGAVGALGAAGPAVPGPLLYYVEPEQCRCECHTRDDELPLLRARSTSVSPEDAARGGEWDQHTAQAASSQ